MTNTPAPAPFGRFVHYTLTEADAAEIQRQRTKAGITGNFPAAGQTYQSLVVRTFGGSACNLQVFLDGPDVYWATSRCEGEPDEQGKWIWPPRV